MMTNNVASTSASTLTPYQQFALQGGTITICKPSMRNAKQLTLNPYSVRKTPTAGSLSTRRTKFEPAFLLR